MHLNLENKVVLITGGTKGIGRAIVRAFLSEGATVHFCARSQPDIDAATTTLAADFPSARTVGTAVDIADPDALKTWITRTADANAGVIDVAIANASALAIDDTPEAWQRAFDVDLRGLHTLAAAALPYLSASASSGRGGNLLTIASVSGRDVDFTAPSPYGPAKAAVIHYTASLARAWAPKGVRANSVSPGNIYVADGVWGGIERGMPEVFARQMAKNPMGRMGRAEEVAEVVVFVASARAGFVSGSNVVVDGALCEGVQF